MLPADPPADPGPNGFHVALATEIALVPAAFLLGRLVGVPPLDTLHLSLLDLALGLVGALPMLILLAPCVLSRAAPFARLRQHIDAILDLILPGRSLAAAFLLSACAGVGEEVLFRGTLQAGLSNHIGLVPSLLLISILFGLLHAVTPTYALFATLMGLYLGLLWLWSGNLLVAIVAHGFYDFLALAYYLRASRSPTIVRDQDPTTAGD